MSLGLYLHIPYCFSKCRYCDFYSHPGERGVPDAYVDALLRELHRFAPDAPLRPDTLYFRWMALGLLVTFAAAFVTATTPLFYVVNSLYLLFTIAELALVFVLSARVQNMSVGAARGVFLGYALLNGMVLSYYFLAFEVGTLVLAFLATSLYFGLMAVYGTTTHKDLSGWGPKLMMALFALLITGFVGLLFGMGFMGTVLYSGIGLVVFMLLTAYDTQKLSQMYSYYAGDSELAEKASIYGALTLYLDFINIFLYVVRLLGLNSRRRD